MLGRDLGPLCGHGGPGRANSAGVMGNPERGTKGKEEGLQRVYWGREATVRRGQGCALNTLTQTREGSLALLSTE